MTATAEQAPRIQFSHLGINVNDLALMEKYYCDTMGFFVTDRGEVPDLGIELVFMSMDPTEHHQFVISTGRPTVYPADHKANYFSGFINQISFRLENLTDLRKMKARFEERGEEFFAGNHGMAWTIYTKDPEGNTLELFVDTPWMVPQPYLVPLDLDGLSDEEIYAETEAMCRSNTNFTEGDAYIAAQSKLMDRPAVTKPFKL